MGASELQGHRPCAGSPSRSKRFNSIDARHLFQRFVALMRTGEVPAAAVASAVARSATLHAPAR